MEHVAFDTELSQYLEQVETASWNRVRTTQELSQFVLSRHESLDYDEAVDSLMTV